MENNLQQPISQQSSVQQSVNQQPPATKTSSGNKLKWILLIIIFLILAFGCGTYYLGIRQNKVVVQNQEKQITPTIAQTAPTSTLDPTANWKTYASATEKASFKYPSNWIVAEPAIKSNFPNADETAIQSPDGKIKVTWVSALDGFGGACDDKLALGQEGACPLFTLVDKTPIGGAQDFYVVSGTITADGMNFQPFLAVQDNGPWKLLSTQRTMGYDMFEGKNNGSLSENRGNNTNALFSTSGAYGSGPNLTQTGAAAWFNNPEVQQAKLILLSLTYAEPESVDTFIQNYYNSYLSCINNHFDQAENNANYNKRIDQACPINKDDFVSSYSGESATFCAQNTPQSLTFDKAVISTDGKTAMTVVHAIWGGNSPGNINVELQKINNQWKIASINCNK